MSGLASVFLQLAATQPVAPAPDIELKARVNAREVTVQQQGKASLELRVSPGVAPPVVVERSQPAGAPAYRNLTVEVRGAVRIADPSSSQPEQQGTNDEVTPP
jgi:hypothetical protein